MNLLKTKLAGIVLKLSRLRFFQPIVKYFFKHLSNLLPVDQIRENQNWIVFYHPKPDYPLHIVILPKCSIESMSDAPADAPDFYADLFKIVQDLIHEFQLTEYGYRLITNGGPNQTIPQWHWHLISENKYFAKSKQND